MINKIILSPPLSNVYPSIKNTTKIVGTYTLNKRKGLHRVITTLKRTNSGWINSVGLRNPGIDKCKNKNNIISISEINPGDFDILLEKISRLDKILGIEFNISCPNVKVSSINRLILTKAKEISDFVIVKIPHNMNQNNILELLDTNEFILHISNTKKTKSGALSGKDLICKNLNTIYNLKKKRPDVKIIGGGGIYDLNTLLDYKDAGADYFSLSTIMINPFKTVKLLKDFKNLSSINY